jgi:hypothetical protein
MNGRLETIDGNAVLRFERRLDHSVERVWRAITEPEELRNWFPPGADLQVTESDPPRVLAGSWFGDTLRFELQHEGEGCLFVFTHTFSGREKAARDAAGWDSCFARFDALLAGKTMSEADSLESWPEAHERYAQHFDVDPVLGREAFAQHRPQQ